MVRGRGGMLRRFEAPGRVSVGRSGWRLVFGVPVLSVRMSRDLVCIAAWRRGHGRRWWCQDMMNVFVDREAENGGEARANVNGRDGPQKVTTSVIETRSISPHLAHRIAIPHQAPSHTFCPNRQQTWLPRITSISTRPARPRSFVFWSEAAREKGSSIRL